MTQPTVIYFDGQPAGIDWGDRLGYFPFISPKAVSHVNAQWIKKYNKLTVIARTGQSHIDEPVSVESHPTAIAVTVSLLFKDPTPPLVLKRLTHFERTRFRWMKPDGRGGLKIR